jgi:hypothetical protein
MSKVMTIEHPRWPEFIATLENFVDEHGCHQHDGTRHILRSMHDIDVDATMAYLRAHGGCCCECEVLENVEASASRQ